MSYTKIVLPRLFDDCARAVDFYKNGKLFAYDCGDGRGIQIIPPVRNPIELTRAQGFRYWERHFPERACYTLPALLEEAVDREPKSFGIFFDRNGEEIGYCG